MGGESKNQEFRAHLMLATKPALDNKAATRIGGLPLAPAGMPWPQCASCKGPMQFLAQIHLPDTSIADLQKRSQMLLLFQCENKPYECGQWDENKGGNAALLVSVEKAVPLSAPEGPTTLKDVQGVKLKSCDEMTKDEYLEALGGDPPIVGKVGGQPFWIQDDQTPECTCGRQMSFVVQIEADAGGGIQFGGNGAGFAFACSHCDDKAKLLSQC